MRNLLIGLLVISAMAFVSIGCKPKYPNCKKDVHCQENETCVNGVCQQCKDNGDCDDGAECESGACRDIPGYCRQNTDCADNQVCRETRCGPCMSSDDCSQGSVCLDGRCLKPECDTTEDCPAGTSCQRHQCLADDKLSGLGSGDCELETLYFGFDSSELGSDLRKAIQKNYDCLQKRGGSVILEGHCDPRGTTEYNMALGERRALVVKKILKNLGMEPGDLRVSSKGEEESSGSSESGWSMDRRVEFR